MSPRAFHALTRDPKTEEIIFVVSSKHMLRITLRSIEIVAIAVSKKRRLAFFRLALWAMLSNPPKRSV